MREVGAKRDRDREERGMEREVSITGSVLVIPPV